MENSQKRKVIHIITGLKIGGAETVLNNLVREINEIDHIVISLGGLDYYGRELKRCGYNVIALNFKDNLLFFTKLIKLYKLIKQNKPEIVHTWLNLADLIGGLTAKLAGVENIYWSIVNDYMPAKSSLKQKIGIKLLALLSRYVPTKIISCSEVSSLSHKLAGYKSSLIDYIPLGVCTKTYKPNKSLGREVRKRLDISNNQFLIGTIARYHPNKDHNNLLESLYILSSKRVNFKCILVGRGINAKNRVLSERIHSLGLATKIILIEETSDIYELINSLDLYVSSSYKEGFPNILIQNMACSIPCVSTNAGDAVNIIGDTGWVVNIDSPNELALAILNAKKINNLITKGELARQRVKRLFDIKFMINRYKDVYKAYLT